MVGLNTNQGSISASHAGGTVSGSGDYVGGLVGYNNGGNVSASYATGSVSGASDVGGLVGVHYDGTIANSYAIGQVTGFAYVGGLIGRNASTLAGSYALGGVSGKSGNVGGLVGNNAGTISESYAVGSVSGNADVGGLAGQNIGAIASSYWDTTASGTMTGVGSGASAGAVGLATQEWLTQGPIATGAFGAGAWVTGYPYPVLKALPYVVINAAPAQATYGAAPPSFTVSSVIDQAGRDASAIVNTSGIQFFAMSSATMSLGSHILGGTGAALANSQSGYQITYDGQLTIQPATLTITPGNQTKTYGQALALGTTDFTVSGLLNNDRVTSVTLSSAGASATAAVGASPYAIAGSNATGTGLSNYTISYDTGSLTVNPAALTITPGNQAKTYGQALALGTTNFSVSGLLGNDRVTGVTLSSAGALATAAVGVSPYTIAGSNATGTGLSNYTISYGTGSLTVTPAPLTITPAAQSSIYGTTPVLNQGDYSETGLVTGNGDSINSVVLTTTATRQSTVGTYAISASKASGTGFRTTTLSTMTAR
ncbi:unnamed protein product [Acidocella sp. C78]|uniref:beta strand repeat-containing protein n=1 Tax=Acidocella sp. C78 TaxID=1671486 RepID=UPI00191BAAE0|nr:MBG domain-containing protein [Acidocella sp. C78]CAG4925128.1 unnamed protein product [Acidocella sp. C78]